MNGGRKKYFIIATVVTIIVVGLIVLLPLFNVDIFKHDKDVKEKLEQAQALFDKDDYLGAIRIYKGISKSEYDSSKLNLAKEKFYNQTKESVDLLLKNGDFDGALDSYKKAIENIGVEDAGILVEDREKLELNYRMYVTPSVRIDCLRKLHPQDRLDNKENKNVIVYKVYGKYGDDVVDNCVFQPEVVSSPGKENVSVYIGNDVFNAYVEVGAECNAIELSTNKDTIYSDETLSPEDVNVKASFADGSIESYSLEDVLGSCSVSALKPEKLGVFEVSVDLWGAEGRVNVDVVERPYITLIKAECLVEPTVGDVLTKDMFRAWAVYSDSNEEIITDFSISESGKLSKVGENKVTINWTDVNGTSFNCKAIVNVLPKLISLSAKFVGAPIEVGSVVTSDMLKVTGEYSDKSKKEIKSFVIDNNVINYVGDNTITISYGGIKGTVTVLGLGVTGITAQYNGEALMVGDAINAGDIQVKANFSDGSTKGINDFSISPATITGVGTNSITISYEGKTDLITIIGIEKKYTYDKEDNNSLGNATSILLNENISGNLDTNDKDFYKVELKETGILNVSLTSTTLYGVEMRLYDANENSISSWTWTKSNTTGTVDKNTLFYLNAGEYFIKISPYSGGGSYTLKCDYTSSNVNHTENNNEMSMASKIDMGNEIIGQLSDTHTGVEKDFFNVSLATSGKLTISLKSITLHGVEMRLYDSDGSSIRSWTWTKSSTTGNVDDHTSFYLNAGEYFIKISPYSGSGAYTLKCDYLSSNVNHTENNNEMSMASKIDTGNEIFGQLSDTHTGVEKDFFNVSLATSGKLTISLKSTTLYGVEMRLYDADGSSISSWTWTKSSTTGNVDNSVSFYLNAGEYFIKISPYSGSGAYTLKCDYLSSNVNHTENNNELSMACRISVGSKIIGQLSDTHSGVEKDFFNVCLATSGNLTISLKSTTLYGVEMRLINSEGKSIESWTWTKSSTTGNVDGSKSYSLNAGEYFIRISPYSGSGVYEFLCE